MKRTIVTVITAATLSLGVAATSVNAMGQELNMLTGAIYNELASLGLPTDKIGDLSLAEIAQIQAFLNDETGMGRAQGIKKILDAH